MFDASELAALAEIAGYLRAQGWAEWVMVEGLLRGWHQLSDTIDKYRGTIDDYTNDLTKRDGLEIVLSRCHEPLRAKLGAHTKRL
jgi:hypothetical protein